MGEGLQDPPARTMTAAHKRALRDGRERAARQRRREAIARVRAWKKWCELSAKDFAAALGKMPERPSDHDYRVSRGEA